MTPLETKRPLQLNDQGQLRHFLSLDGLRRELLTEILDTADSFLEVGARAVKKVPLLRGKTVCNVFFEKLHPHPHHLRTGGPTAVGGRDHPQRVHVLGEQG
nr:hypothetical protein GCM10020185_38610 [Pseudomonas brassicacearum subsp. brassicacearum]